MDCSTIGAGGERGRPQTPPPPGTLVARARPGPRGSAADQTQGQLGQSTRMAGVRGRGVFERARSRCVAGMGRGALSRTRGSAESDVSTDSTGGHSTRGQLENDVRTRIIYVLTGNLGWVCE